MAVTLPAGFTIDTVTSPDRVRVQWPASGASSLPNLGFESGDTDWIKGAGWEISTGGLVETGTFSAKYRGTGQSAMQHSQLAPVTPGTTITATARISTGNTRADFAGGEPVLEWFDADLTFLGFARSVDDGLPRGPAFKTVTTTGTAPAGAAFVRLVISATRDVKGRASDAVYVDNVAWNHSFALGGVGGGGAPTGPITFTFRVRDANGCTAVATRTIAQQVILSSIFSDAGVVSGSVNSFTVPLPSGTQAGDIVILATQKQTGSGDFTAQSVTPFNLETSSAISYGRLWIDRFAVTATQASSGLINVSCGASPASQAVWAVVVIPASLAFSPVATVVGGASGSVDPPSVSTSFGSNQALVVAFLAGENTRTVSGYPLTGGNQRVQGSVGSLALCRQTLPNAASYNPAAFTVGGSSSFDRAITLAIRLST